MSGQEALSEVMLKLTPVRAARNADRGENVPGVCVIAGGRGVGFGGGMSKDPEAGELAYFQALRGR